MLARTFLPAESPALSIATAGGDPPINRPMITLSIMTATVMIALDTTIANVALPHMQGSVSASADQITWVLTSYIVAGAIFTPLTGWLTGRYGRKLVFLVAVGGFTLTSALCGVANSLAELVLFRLLQGAFGAALLPMSQAVLLDINPPEKHGQAMAVWGMGAMLGPIMGPALGGWLTENLSWRWCFLINVPFGVMTMAGIFFFIHSEKKRLQMRLDFFGFAALGLGLGALQLMLDTGQIKDWFNSPVIWAEAVIGALAFTVVAIHTATTEQSFLPKALFRDRNFVFALVFGFILGLLVYATMALLPQLAQVLLEYPVWTTGLVMAPRGVGTLLSMFIVGRMVGRMDIRLILLTGLTLSAIASWQMSHFALNMTPQTMAFSGFLQGIGTGLLFVPLSTAAFSTLPRQWRADGAGVYTLTRNIGASVGIATLQALQINKSITVHSDLSEKVLPGGPQLSGLPIDLSTVGGISEIDHEVARQAAMVAYVNVFHLMTLICLLAVPLLLMVRSPKAREQVPKDAEPHLAVE
jgi:DHA2 family multidrug resistance protein